MPLDVSVIPTKQQVPDIGGAISQLMNLQNSNLQYQQANQAIQANQAVSRAVQQNTDQNGNVNVPEVMKLLAADPQAAYNLPQNIAALGQSQTAITQAQTAKAAQAAQLVENLTPYATKWANLGEKLSPEIVQQDISQALSRGLIPANLAMEAMQSMPEKGATPQEWAAWGKNESDVLLDHKSAIESRFGSYVPDAGNGQPGFVNRYQGTITPVNFQQTNQPPVIGKGEEQTQLPYPIRQAGSPAPTLPQEIADTAEGQKFVTNLNNTKGEITTARRNLDEVLDKAVKLSGETTKVPGHNLVSDSLNASIRKIHNWANDPEYIQLSKDLANVQLTNMRASGNGGTDAARALQAHADGTAVYPPEVLADIASRAKSDLRNLDMKTTAANNFVKKYGYQNLKSFQDLWNNHADSKLFQMMDVYDNSNLNASEKKAERDKLVGITPTMSAEQKKARLAEFAKKNSVLERLVNTGEL